MLPTPLYIFIFLSLQWRCTENPRCMTWPNRVLLGKRPRPPATLRSTRTAKRTKTSKNTKNTNPKAKLHPSADQAGETEVHQRIFYYYHSTTGLSGLKLPTCCLRGTVRLRDLQRREAGDFRIKLFLILRILKRLSSVCIYQVWGWDF